MMPERATRFQTWTFKMNIKNRHLIFMKQVWMSFDMASGEPGVQTLRKLVAKQKKYLHLDNFQLFRSTQTQNGRFGTQQ